MISFKKYENYKHKVQDIVYFLREQGTMRYALIDVSEWQWWMAGELVINFVKGWVLITGIGLQSSRLS